MNLALFGAPGSSYIVQLIFNRASTPNYINFLFSALVSVLFLEAVWWLGSLCY
jgi:hypothetical protein